MAFSLSHPWIYGFRLMCHEVNRESVVGHSTPLSPSGGDRSIPELQSPGSRVFDGRIRREAQDSRASRAIAFDPPTSPPGGAVQVAIDPPATGKPCRGLRQQRFVRRPRFGDDEGSARSGPSAWTGCSSWAVGTSSLCSACTWSTASWGGPTGALPWPRRSLLGAEQAGLPTPGQSAAAICSEGSSTSTRGMRCDRSRVSVPSVSSW